MKRLTIILCLILILPVLVLPAYANKAPIITQQPQNCIFPENSVATWSVEATGTDLSYTWYIRYHGIDYCTLTSFNEGHPWQEGVLGSGYGWNQTGNVFYINGIGSALDGAVIFCIVTSGANDFTVSHFATISVSGQVMPPTLVVPASVTIEQDKILKLYCDATAAEGDEVISYLWYETTTGELKDIVAIGINEGYEENYPILVCDTTTPGTRYYVCMVETQKGGRAYSSVIPVTVKKSGSQTKPTQPTSPSTKPTNPPTQPTNPPDKPTDPPVQPTTPTITRHSSVSAPTEPTETTGSSAATTPGNPVLPNKGTEASEPLEPSTPTVSRKGFGSLSPLPAILIALGGIAVGGGIACLIIVLVKKNKNGKE